MASSVEDYSTTAASNTGEFPENQNPSTVNDGARKVQGHIAQWVELMYGTFTVGGTVDAITATTTYTDSAYTNGRIYIVEAAGANTSTTPSFSADGIGAKTITKFGNQALVAGDIYGAGHRIILQYDSSNDVFELLNPSITLDFFNITATASEINTACDGITATAAEINTACDGITATASEINAICDGKTLTSSDDKIDNFPAGTIMAFQQPTAPYGWTKESTHNDKALRVVTGTPSSGGTTAFSTIFSTTATDAHALTVAEMPAHNHGGGNHRHYTQFTTATVGGGGAERLVVGSNPTSNVNTSYSGTIITTQGSDTGHTHDIDLVVQYVDIILAAKD